MFVLGFPLPPPKLDLPLSPICRLLPEPISALRTRSVRIWTISTDLALFRFEVCLILFCFVFLILFVFLESSAASLEPTLFVVVIYDFSRHALTPI
ncbi:unnamed protein product [Camellia sinensis]